MGASVDCSHPRSRIGVPAPDLPTSSRGLARSCSNFDMGYWRFVPGLASVFAVTLLPHAASGQEPLSTPPASGSSENAAPSSSASASALASSPGGRAARPAGSDVILPGFEILADGSTRLFVELSRPVTYETKVGHGSITVILKDAHIERRNNLNPLVTVHFNTPVTSARLRPHGRDVWLVVELRAAVHPSVAVDAGKDGGAVMRIEFPKGDYLRAGPKGDPAASSSGDPVPSADESAQSPAAGR